MDVWRDVKALAAKHGDDLAVFWPNCNIKTVAVYPVTSKEAKITLDTGGMLIAVVNKHGKELRNVSI